MTNQKVAGSCAILRHKIFSELDGRRFLNLKHASYFLDMPVGTLRKRYMEGRIRYMKDPYSKRIYFSSQDLVRYMQKGEQKSIRPVM